MTEWLASKGSGPYGPSFFSKKMKGLPGWEATSDPEKAVRFSEPSVPGFGDTVKMVPLAEARAMRAAWVAAFSHDRCGNDYCYGRLPDCPRRIKDGTA